MLREFSIRLFLLLAGFGGLASTSGLVFAQDAQDNADHESWAVRAELSERRLAKNPKDETAWANLVKARIDGQDFPRAEKALIGWKNKVAHVGTNFQILLGEVAFAKRDYNGAIQAWKQYLSVESKDVEIWKRLAKVYEAQGEWNSAVDAAGSALELKPEASGYVERARYRIRLHDWAGAETDVRQSNKMDPSNDEVKKLFPIFERSSEWWEPLKKLDALIQGQPGDYRLWLDRAEWMVGLGFRDAGWDDVRTAFKLNPKSIRARIWNGIMAPKSDRSETAEDVAQIGLVNVTSQFEAELKAMDSEPNPEKRARFLLRQKQPLMALNEVRESDGSPAKAIALFVLERLPEAGKAAHRAAEKNPEDPMAWLALANLEAANGNSTQASEALQRSSKLKKTKEFDEIDELLSEAKQKLRNR